MVHGKPATYPVRSWCRKKVMTGFPAKKKLVEHIQEVSKNFLVLLPNLRNAAKKYLKIPLRLLIFI